MTTQPTPDEQSTIQTETEVVHPKRVTLRLFTDGKNPTIDRLGLLMEVLGQMPDNERRAALKYAVNFYKVNAQ